MLNLISESYMKHSSYMRPWNEAYSTCNLIAFSKKVNTKVFIQAKAKTFLCVAELAGQMYVALECGN